MDVRNSRGKFDEIKEEFVIIMLQWLNLTLLEAEDHKNLRFSSKFA